MIDEELLMRKQNRAIRRLYHGPYYSNTAISMAKVDAARIARVLRMNEMTVRERLVKMVSNKQAIRHAIKTAIRSIVTRDRKHIPGYEYRRRPEVKEHKRAYDREYGKRPEVKARKYEFHRRYAQRPEVKTRLLEYKRKRYQQRPDIRAYHQEQSRNRRRQ